MLPVAARFAAAKRVEEITKFLIKYGDEQRAVGKFDSALEAYLAALRAETQRYQCDPAGKSLRTQILHAIQVWGAGSGQTAERIGGAIESLQTWHAALPPPEELLLPLYQEGELAIDDFPAATGAGVVGFTDASWITSRLAWERKRARRLLDMLAYWQLSEAKPTAAAMAENHPTGWEYFTPDPGVDLPVIMHPPDWLPRAWWVGLVNTPLVAESSLSRRSIARLMLSQETDYRATLIILALEAWRIEHRSLPQELDELVGDGLKTVPLDPLNAIPFDYQPKPAQPLVPRTVLSSDNLDWWLEFPYLLGARNANGPTPSVMMFGNNYQRRPGSDGSANRCAMLYPIPEVWKPQP